MTKIHVLPEVLAHKIAAGEVVERPASVIKELLENSLDAGAKSIKIAAQGGGKSLISVRDNGTGMNREDARLAFQHHATSKIDTFEDISRIQTLGFRGEALPSIASVSRLRMRTIDCAVLDSAPPLGTEVEIFGGKVQKVSDTAWPVGTEVIVEDLFFNVPARRKFLKNPATELRYLSRQIMHYAIACPEVEFQFTHNGRSVLEAPKAEKLSTRLCQVFSESFVENLVPVEYEHEDFHVSGFTSLPHEQRSNSQSQFIFVNRRIVKDRVLMHAIRQAYQDAIPSGTYPVVILFLEIPPAQIDVNVHPSKTEIRFRNSQQIHSALYHGIQEALLKGKSNFRDLARDLSLKRAPIPGRSGNGVDTSVAKFFQRHASSGQTFPAFLESRVPKPSETGQTSIPAVDSPPATYQHSDEIPQTDYLSLVPAVLGQFVESFIVAADREGVMLIDQHVAHERILYEQAFRTLHSSNGCTSQQLLVPITYDLNAEQTAMFHHIGQALNSNGFEVDWFGEQTVVIKGVPSFATQCDVQALIREVLTGFSSLDQEKEPTDKDLMRLREKIAIGLSCRAAIKINTPLTKEKMDWLLDELFRCENPYTCPHGRPIVLRLGIEEILRNFKRI